MLVLAGLEMLSLRQIKASNAQPTREGVLNLMNDLIVAQAYNQPIRAASMFFLHSDLDFKSPMSLVNCTHPSHSQIKLDIII